jgi:DNA-binding NarL/FixJ family response regulator
MLRALLIEDDPFFRRAVATLLMNQFPGIAVEEAEDGDVGMRQLAQRKPDVVFLDIGLPGRSGIRLTREIKSLAPSVEVVVLSSHDTPEYREAALREGADAYICKTAAHCREEIISRVARLSRFAPSPV